MESDVMNISEFEETDFDRIARLGAAISKEMKGAIDDDPTGIAVIRLARLLAQYTAAAAGGWAQRSFGSAEEVPLLCAILTKDFAEAYAASVNNQLNEGEKGDELDRT